MSRRLHRVEDQLRREIAELLLRRVEDPRVGMATVTAVDVTPDLRHAIVDISVIGSEAERQESIEGLEAAGGFIRRELGRRLRLKAIPELSFRLDRGAEHAMRIQQLLDEQLEDKDDDDPGT